MARSGLRNVLGALHVSFQVPSEKSPMKECYKETSFPEEETEGQRGSVPCIRHVAEMGFAGRQSHTTVG